MATLATNVLTLSDWAKRKDPDGKIAAIVELLNQSNEILQDMLWLEGNLPTGHRTTVRTGLPDVAWRKLNYGVPQSKSTTVQVDEGTGMLEAFGQVDKDLAELNGNTGEFRLSENVAFLESMNQEMAATLFYGNSTSEPEAFTGLAPRYSALSGAATSQNILNAGGSTGLTSIWLVGWGNNTINGIYPKGSMAGLQHTDIGLDTVTDAAGGKYRAYQDHYQWKCGLSVRDWRFASRVANVAVADLVALATTQASTAATEIIKLMSRQLDRIPSFGNCRPVFYMNRTVFSMLRVMALQKSSNALSIEQGLDQFGNPVRGNMAFMGIPIRRVDALLNTETAVA
jgi:hypothetical protein